MSLSSWSNTTESDFRPGAAAYTVASPYTDMVASTDDIPARMGTEMSATSPVPAANLTVLDEDVRCTIVSRSASIGTPVLSTSMMRTGTWPVMVRTVPSDWPVGAAMCSAAALNDAR